MTRACVARTRSYAYTRRTWWRCFSLSATNSGSVDAGVPNKPIVYSVVRYVVVGDTRWTSSLAGWRHTAYLAPVADSSPSTQAYIRSQQGINRLVWAVDVRLQRSRTRCPRHRPHVCYQRRPAPLPPHSAGLTLFALVCIGERLHCYSIAWGVGLFH